MRIRNACAVLAIAIAVILSSPARARKVRIWDRDNRLSDYSEAQRFETGDFAGTVSTKNTFQVEHIAPQAVTRTGIGAYFENDQSRFTSSDPILDQVWDICKYSIKATILDKTTDAETFQYMSAKVKRLTTHLAPSVSNRVSITSKFVLIRFEDTR